MHDHHSTYRLIDQSIQSIQQSINQSKMLHKRLDNNATDRIECFFSFSWFRYQRQLEPAFLVEHVWTDSREC
jgi:hypothetical protein